LKIFKFTILTAVFLLIANINFAQDTTGIVGTWKESPESVRSITFKADGSFSETLQENYTRSGMWKIVDGQIIIDHTVTPAMAVYTTTIYEKYEVGENTLKLFRTDIEYKFIKIIQ
jgi:hypothetical protein